MNTLHDTIQQLEAQAASDAFSGVISWAQGEETLFEKAYGFADRSNRIANRIDTRFGIASGTKGFTALAIAVLIQEGAVSLSSPATSLVDADLPMVSPDVTIKHLLAHTSGIPDYYDEEEVDDFEDFFLDIPWYRLKHPTDYLPLFPDKPVKFPPGEGFSYCNGGFILLGAIVEAVTGKPFQAFVQERVFDALGMEESGFFPMNALPERTAFGYVKKPEGWITNIYHLPIIGASDGGAFTTAADMQRFWRGLWAENVLSPDLRGLFWKPNRRAEDEGPDVYYGHGFWVKAPMARTPFPFLEGADAGVSFQSLFIPESDTVITLLSNTLEGIWPLAGIIHAHIAGNLPAHSQADTTTETT